MDQLFNEKLLKLGFEQRIETLFALHVHEVLFATSSTWQIFAYFEDGKYYFSSNGDLVEMFDAPDIDIDYMLDKISTEIGKFGCYLNVSKIVKEIDLINLEQDLNDFISAVYAVDEIYKNL